MRRHVFNRIRKGAVGYEPYFEFNEDALGKLGFSSYQKCTPAIRMLAYGIPGDLVDEYVHMSESTCILSMYNFCKDVVAAFGPEYLREPNAVDTESLLAINADMGFPGMLGSIDCMHWKWKNCPFVWQGQYKGHVKVFARLAEGHFLEVNFEINGHHYNKGYYLADGIYSQWSTLVKTIPPQGEKRQRFAQIQENDRKDVERAFGVLQSRWGIV
ncbi:uncharacterized protein [Aegilops tauschii subsp. strangulata]|uniref:uncharacterized protein n=1 Tax=Aegilops tauschii subsp. strangulata TaxID=200361 RepID=UPI00098A26DB|nr:uncharacterized protein LOC109777291 [Aegilops tauschii subsp. strangulata]